MKNDSLLSVREFARYENKHPKTIRRWISQNKIEAAKDGEAGGGKQVVKIDCSWLSTDEARQRFLADRQLPKADAKHDGTGKTNLKPWQRKEADKRLSVVLAYLEACPTIQTRRKRAFDKAFARQHAVKSFKTVLRWVDSYKIGGYKALVPAWTGVKNSLFDREIARFIQGSFMRPDGPAAIVVFEELQKKFSRSGRQLPSRSAFIKYINRTWTKEQQLLVRNYEAWSRLYGPFVRRDWSLEKLNSLWFGDHKQIDLACLYHGKPIFPWLTVWIEAKSRKYVGWVLTPTPDSTAVGQSFARGVRSVGAPLTAYIDRGKSFKARSIVGSKIETAEARPFDDFDGDKFTGILHQLGTEVYFAAPYNAKEKGMLEASFKLFTHRPQHFPGWRGHSVKTRPKKLAREIKEGHLLQFEELVKVVDKMISERNDRVHPSTGQSPMEFWKDHVAVVPAEELLAFLLMETSYAKVKDSTITVAGLLYRGENLWRLAGQRVEVRRDPEDITKAAVVFQDKLFEIVHLETPGHWRGPITQKNLETCKRIRRNVRKWRRTFVEAERFLDDPLRMAAAIEERTAASKEDVRPAALASKGITSIGGKTRVAKEVVRALSTADRETSRETRKEAALARYASIIGGDASKETDPPRHRLVTRLTLDDE
jgi:hypothetical protein